MKKILITGANGFLAKSIISLLDGGDSELVALVRPGSVLQDQRFSKVHSDRESLFKSEKNFTHIFHFAAHIPYGAMNRPDPELINTNVSFTTMLTDAYPEARFVYSSSVAVYGRPQNLPIEIDSPFIEPNHYGLSKLAGEAVIKNLASYSIIRFTSMIGHGMKKESFIPIIIDEALKAGTITVFGDGSREQNYIDVRDAATLCVVCARSDANITTLGVSDRSYRNDEIAAMVSSITGATIAFKGQDNSGSFRYDVGDSHRQLHFRPTFTIKQTLSEMTIK